ncbi:subtilisin-like protease SBT5.3 [Nymphaea colorata]|nr:subtilisin-like protease SBT5.3 [Nymphaea colorata]
MEPWLPFCLALLFCLSLTTTHAEKKSYIVYMGKHSHSSLEAVDHDLVRESHYDFLGNFLGSKEKARDSLFYSYTNHINGFAAHLEEEEVAEIAKGPGVVSVFPNRRYSLHTTRTWQFLGLEENGLTLPGSAWEKATYGEDVIIANLDTGVWPESESFNDEGFGPIPAKWKGVCQNSTDENGVKCNKKLIGARYFDKGYISYYHHPDNRSFSSPRDNDGHGTHTLSTAAGSTVRNASIFGFAHGTAKGGSPRARVVAYKVCWSSSDGEGTCLDADILAAFDAAIGDGVDIISASLGGGPTDYIMEGFAIGSFHAVSSGISVVASGGNDGPVPSTVSNVAPWIFTIAASTLDRDFPSQVSLGNNITLTGQSISADFLPKGLYPLAAGQDLKISNATEAGMCLTDSLDPQKTKGKIVVCLRGGNARVEKGYVVQKAGGIGMILCNNAASGNELLADAHVLPASHLTASDGKKVYDYITSTKSPLAYIAPAFTKLNSKPSPVVAAFSSRGPNLVTEGILKPDVTAPGVNILAAFTEASSPTDLAFDERRVKFNIVSGTSMSCPHVSGIVGLVKKVHPDWSPAAIKSAIMTTARRRDNMKEPIRDADLEKATSFAYGAGHVRPNRALDPGLVYDISINDYVNFFCALGYNSSMIYPFTGKEVSCSSQAAKVADLNYPSITFVNLNGEETVSRTVKNVGTPGTYKVRVQYPPGVTVTVKPDSLKFENIGEEKQFTVTAKVNRTSEGYVFGRLIWSDGKHNVRSPIVVKVGAQ